MPLRLPLVSGWEPRAVIKRFVAALTRWELRPIVNRVNDLQYRTDSEIARLQRQLDEVSQAVSMMAGHPRSDSPIASSLPEVEISMAKVAAPETAALD